VFHIVAKQRNDHTTGEIKEEIILFKVLPTLREAVRSIINISGNITY
jgi:hypothetical protein